MFKSWTVTLVKTFSLNAALYGGATTGVVFGVLTGTHLASKFIAKKK